MSRISIEQIIEILDEKNIDHIRIRKHDLREDVFVVTTNNRDGRDVDREDGPDIGELVNELHTRL